MCFPMFDRPVFGWLPWALEESKKFILTINILVISWSFIMYTQKNNFKNPTLPLFVKYLNLTLKWNMKYHKSAHSTHLTYLEINKL
jgi:hypothetical protein